MSDQGWCTSNVLSLTSPGINNDIICPCFVRMWFCCQAQDVLLIAIYKSVHTSVTSYFLRIKHAMQYCFLGAIL